MERNLLLRSTAAFLLLFTAGIIVFCRSQAHVKIGSNFHADGGSHVRKGSSSSLNVVLPPVSVLSSPGREDKTGSNTRVVFETQAPIRNLSPPHVWPTSADRAPFVPGRHSQVSSFRDHSLATSLGDKVRLELQRLAPDTRPTTKIDTPQQSLFLAPEIIVKMVSSLTALFNSPSSKQHGVQPPKFSDNPPPPADPNVNSLLLASDGELSRYASSLIRNISPAEMRPITTTPNDDEVDSSGIVRKPYKHRRALLRGISPPGMWPITSDDDDEFALHRRRALLSDDSTSSSSSATATTSGRYQKHRRALLRDISPPGMWPITSDDDEFQVNRRRALLSSETASTSGRYQKQRRALLRDISPPGMWPITSDNDDEFEFAGRRALLSHNSPQLSSNSAAASTSDRNQNHKRALLRDISPPGMWPITSDDDEFVNARRRALLSDDLAHSSSATASTIDRYRYHKQRRALLRDISPPGMWPVTSDDDEFSVHRRRALLSDGHRTTNSPSATATISRRHQKQRRALLRDISPPGMWPISSDSDDDELAVARRRSLLSDDSANSSPATASTSDRHRYQKQRRALLRDISPPGMWPITSDDDDFEVARRRSLL